jgi:hypothetical protein
MEIVIASLWIWSGLICNSNTNTGFFCIASILTALVTTLVVLL